MRRIMVLGASLLGVLSIGIPSVAHAGKLTMCKMVVQENNESYCEKTLTSGVRIESKSGKLCTAGPMLVKGDETYVLTAGHCGPENEEWFSREPGGVKKKIGKAINREYPNSGDFEEIKIEAEEDMATNWAEPFGGPNFDPVWPDMVEWGEAENKKVTSHAVADDAEPKKGDEVCYEGYESGEHCGHIKNTKETIGTEGPMVEVDMNPITLLKGDSGGPWFLRKGGEILMEGVTKGRVECDGCDDEGNGLFWSLKVILANDKYKGQKLLDVKTEKRKVKKDSDPLLQG